MDESDYRESEDEDFKLDQNQQSDDEVDSDVEESTAKAIKDQKETEQTERFVRTRSQVEQKQEKQLEIKNSSVDVDALWAEMNSGPASTKVPQSHKAEPSSASKPAQASRDTNATSASTSASSTLKPPKLTDPAASSGAASLTDELITITRTYKFAGEITTETKTVKATSAEGREYLKQQASEKASNLEKPKPKRRVGPVKRAISLEDEFKAGKAKKLNTLAKSKLDWLGFVDNEGIQDDLKKHNKSGYLDKQEFLNRVGMNTEKQQRQ